MRKRDDSAAGCELNNMSREYYILWYRLDYKDSYFIWFTTEKDDGVFKDENNLVPSFSNIKDLQNYAKLNKVTIIDEEPLLFNLDIVINWLNETNHKIEDYNPFLNTWNLFEDISRSTNGNFAKDRHYEIYERIFWGCNISAVTPEGESFTPTWTEDELKTIRKTLTLGFQMFREKRYKFRSKNFSAL